MLPKEGGVSGSQAFGILHPPHSNPITSETFDICQDAERFIQNYVVLLKLTMN